MNQKVMLLLGLAVPLFAVACNSNPVVVPTQEDTPLLMQQDPDAKGAQIDLLWMIDDSGSMAQEQGGLITELKGLADSLRRIDFRVAVTSTDGVGSEKFSLAYNCKSAVYDPSSPQNNRPCKPGEFRNRASLDLNASGVYSAATLTTLVKTATEDCLVPAEQSNAKKLLSDFKAKIDAYTIDCDGQNFTGTAAVNKVLARDCQNPSGPGSAKSPAVLASDLIAELQKFMPSREKLRELGPVLDSSNYEHEGGDPRKPLTKKGVDDLRRDLSCLTLVGTSGSGIEKGIGAVIEAVKKTGPNAGDSFVRPDAKTVLVLASDENDCTHREVAYGGKKRNLNESACLVVACNFFNSFDLQLPPDQNPLISPQELAKEFRTALAQAKGGGRTPESLKSTISSIAITGTALPQPGQTLGGYVGEAVDEAKKGARGNRKPTSKCEGDGDNKVCSIDNPTIPAKIKGKPLSGNNIPEFIWNATGSATVDYCAAIGGTQELTPDSLLQLEQVACDNDAFGRSLSGDRYYRFIEAVGNNYYPDKRGAMGGMCFPDFAEIFVKIRGYVSDEDGDCISKRLVACETGGGSCGPEGSGGQCMPYPKNGNEFFCSAAVQPTIVCTTEAGFAKVKGLCMEGTEGKTDDGKLDSCILQMNGKTEDNYDLKSACPNDKGVKFNLHQAARTTIESNKCRVLLNFTAFAGSSTDKKEESK